MLPPGTSLSVDKKTGATSLSKYENNPKKSSWAFSQGDGLYVVPFRKDNHWQLFVLPLNDLSTKATVSLVKGSMKTKGSLPYEFDMKVTIDGQTHIATLRHTDRFDRVGIENNQNLSLVGGYRPTFCIGLVGAVGSGKTCFWHSLRCATTFNRLSNFFSDSMKCVPVVPQVSRLERTNIATFDGTPIEITSAHGKHATDVLLFDLAGEVTDVDSFSQSHFSAKSYSLAGRIASDEIVRNCKKMDALLVFIKGTSLFTQHAEVIGDMQGFLDKLDTLTQKAVVITEGDLVRERLLLGEQAASLPDKALASAQLAQSELINRAVLKSSSPLFYRCHNMEDMRRHIAFAKSVYEDVFGPVKSPCFLISTLNEKKGKDGEEILDFSAAINAELPLVWLLSHLNHMTIKEE